VIAQSSLFGGSYEKETADSDRILQAMSLVAAGGLDGTGVVDHI